MGKREADMYQFFIEPSGVREQEGQAAITGEDVNHIKNVLRMHAGERIAAVERQTGKRYLCEIREIVKDTVFCEIVSVEEAETELPAKVFLFQGLPKGDKMELILQKAVELGCFEVVPVACKRCVVRFDKKKEKNKVQRWQAIAEAAAKQSGRLIIPNVHDVMTFSEALSYAEDMDVKLIPYERAADMAQTKRLFGMAGEGERIAVFIGPEGGFEEMEIEEAEKAGVIPITLGRRILRTETAAITALSWLMYYLEG